MGGAPAESYSEIPAQLRHRMVNRASTFAEGVRPATPNSPRRRSSLLSTRSSTDSLRTIRNNDMDRTTPSDDSSWLHSSPVFIAIVPAIAALIHPQGGTIATDLVLLLLSAWFLAKCGSVPWQWYVEAQQRQHLDADDPVSQDTIYEEDEDSTSCTPEPSEPAAEGAEDARPSTIGPSKFVDPQDNARRKLKQTELVALAACFLVPVFGAYVVHYLRSQFTHRARDGIVTDLNLFFYVCISEARPVSHLFDMIGKRTLHLQRLVITESPDQYRPDTAQRLPQRLAALEARLDDPVSNDIDMNKITNEVRQTMQHQLDALNRAVRKYEKKQLAQTMQIEARFQDIDVRLRDTLSLAASAARTGQKPGIVSTTLSWISGLIAYAIQIAWDVITYPFRIALSVVEAVKTAFSKEGRHTGRRAKGQLNGHPSIPSTSRMQSKSGR